jgi:hypothetical protein
MDHLMVMAGQPILEQAIADQAAEAGEGPAAAHGKAGHHMLGRGGSDPPQPTGDSLRPSGSAWRLLEAIDMASSVEVSISCRPPC